MKLIKYLSLILLTSGIALISYAGYNIFIQKKTQEDALQEAKAEVVSAREKDKGEEPTAIIDYDFKKGDVVGILNIPALNRELPIIEGTDEEDNTPP